MFYDLEVRYTDYFVKTNFLLSLVKSQGGQQLPGRATVLHQRHRHPVRLDHAGGGAVRGDGDLALVGGLHLPNGQHQLPGRRAGALQRLLLRHLLQSQGDLLLCKL